MESKTKLIIFGIIILFIGIIGIIFNQISSIENSDEINLLEESLVVQEGSENTVEELNLIKVHITGEVVNEGMIELKEGDRIDDAIKKAGGITDKADLSKVNLAYELLDGQKVYIPSINDNKEEYLFIDAGENVLEDENVQNGKININTADSSLLQTINGVGESLAGKIIDYREKNGKFKNIEDLKNVSGVGDKKFEDLKDKIIVK